MEKNRTPEKNSKKTPNTQYEKLNGKIPNEETAVFFL